MRLRAAPSAGLLHRQHHRRALNFCGELPGHLPLLVSVRCPCPPTHTHRSSRETRNLYRLAGVGRHKGTTMVWRGPFNSVRSFFHMFYDFARTCSLLSMHDPRHIWTRWVRRTHWTDLHLMSRSACERGGHGSREDMGEGLSGHVRENRNLWKLSCL